MRERKDSKTERYHRKEKRVGGMQSVGQSHLPKVVPNHLPPTYCRVDMGRYGIFSLIINSARLGETSKNTEKNRIGHVGKRKEYRLNYLYKTDFSIPHLFVCGGFRINSLVRKSLLVPDTGVDVWFQHIRRGF